MSDFIEPVETNSEISGNSDPQQAIRRFEERLASARALGDRRGEGQALFDLGAGLFSLGDERRAIVSLEQALVITRDLGDRQRECQIWLSLGGAHQTLGAARSALKCYAQSLAFLGQFGDRYTDGVDVNSMW